MKKKIIEVSSDFKKWYAISCPTTGVRFDLRTLELMDTDHDGHVRTPEVLAALDYLKNKGVTIDSLFAPSEADRKALDEVVKKQAALDALEPSAEEKKSFAEWTEKGKEAEIAVLGEATEAADNALMKIEKIVDEFFYPSDEAPLVTEAPDRELPLRDHLNPRHLEAILEFAESCVKPLLGEKSVMTRMEWKAIKAKFAPYRAWKAAKPVMNAVARKALEEEERFLRYKLNLGEFLENYVTMDRLYANEGYSIFQTGILRIDGKEMNLCFHVNSEAAHSALVEKSHCCIIYLKLTRANESAERSICAVVTAGTIGALYVGRNGVFYDRDGKDWEATITKIVENQVSLMEAFWSPWRKIGDMITSGVTKFLGEKQSKAISGVQKGVESTQAGGAAMASSVAAIGIGIGMVGAAFASIMAAVSGMTWYEILLSVAVIILAVSMPSVILTWFKLRKRDLGIVLNASGWAINRKMRFSMKRARGFTKCAHYSNWKIYLLIGLMIIVIIAGSYVCRRIRNKEASENCSCEQPKTEQIQQEVK